MEKSVIYFTHVDGKTYFLVSYSWNKVEFTNDIEKAQIFTEEEKSDEIINELFATSLLIVDFSSDYLERFTI